MNISQMMRGLLGEATAGDSRAMELKIGQVVRGVVMQMLENNEAVVQINGVQVRAKLEIPLQPGQSAMLQVQPDSSGALIMLKAVDLSASGLLDDTFKDYAKLLGLPDQNWALDIIKDLRREGFPFNRTTAKAFQEAIAAMPQGADQEQWMQATAATFKRGLPMTTVTISSMQQAMFGKDTHELLDTLQRQLGGFLATDGGVDVGEGKSSHPAARVMLLLEQGAALLRGVMNARDGVSNPLTQSTAPTSQGMSVTVQSSTANGHLLASMNEDAQNAGNSTSRPIVSSSNWLSGMMKWLGVDHELQLAKAATVDDHASSEATMQNRSNAADSTGGNSRSSTAALSQQAGLVDAHKGGEGASTNMLKSADPTSPNVVESGVKGANENRASNKPEIVQQLATEARTVTQRALQGGALFPFTTTDTSILESSQLGQNLQSVQPQATQQESMKSALLSLMSSNDTPPSIKETAQQLIHQITGQQLLLTPERNSSVFTHVTMFIPLKDQQGDSTASVHIQTRRGRRGELDADNCRLLFNLSMQSLGDTLVDVNVTDKIVSLNLWNDHPAIAELIEGSRTDIAERLKETGYQLLSLRTTPLPTNNEETSASTHVSKRQAPPDLSQFSSTRYKGVDYKI